jgi:hypothetical protein
MRKCADMGAKKDMCGPNIAHQIRAGLVCCRIYEVKVKGLAPGPVEKAQLEEQSIHQICFWGEAAAQLAEGSCPGYEMEPNICRCLCTGCTYSCDFHDKSEDELPVRSSRFVRWRNRRKERK